MGLQLLRRARLRLPVPGNVQGTISPVIQTTFHPLPTIVVPPETNSKVSDQLLVPPQAQTMRPEITFGPSNTSVMQREMTPESSDPTVMQPEIASEPSDTSVKPPQVLAAASLETQGNSGVPRSKFGILIYWFAILNSIVSSTTKRNPPLLPTGFKFHHRHHRPVELSSVDCHPRSCRNHPRSSPVCD